MTLIPQYNSTKNDHPFGMLMPGRSYSSTAYKYGFNGKEKDDEVKGAGNSLDFGARIHDPRLGRFLSLDPLSKKFPNESNYSYAGNSPIFYVDKEGEKKTQYILTLHLDGSITVQVKIDYRDVRLKSKDLGDGGMRFYSADVKQTIVQTENGVILSEGKERFSQSKQNYFAQKAKNGKDKILSVLGDAGITDGKQAFGFNIATNGGQNSGAWTEIKGQADIVEDLDLEGLQMPDGIGKDLPKVLDKLVDVVNKYRVLKGLIRIEGVGKEVKTIADINSKSFEASGKIVEAVEYGKQRLGREDKTDSCTTCHKIGTEKEMKEDSYHGKIVKTNQPEK